MTVGVALSGGGARGFAHVGVLRALEENGLKPSVMAGVSAGAVIAVLYGAGVSLEDMEKIFAKQSFRTFCELKLGHAGFFKIERFKKFILKTIGPQFQNIEDLLYPTYLGATDLDGGHAVAFSSGPIGDAMMASCSIPILFQPVKINGVRYVDGGVLRNIPSWVIRDKCDYLVGANCSPLSKDYKFKDSVFDVGMRAYSLLTKGNQSKYMEICDLPIEIDEVADYKVFNLKNIKDISRRGYEVASRKIEEFLSCHGEFKPIHHTTDILP